MQQRDRRPPLTFAADQLNVRPLVAIGPQLAPDPPRPGPVRPARMPIYMFLGIKSHLAVAQDEFVGITDTGSPPQVSMPKGRQEVWAERRNLNVPTPDPYGTQLDNIYAGVPG